jgi:hypothetical protein
VAIKVVAIRNLLLTFQKQFNQLGLKPPPEQTDLHGYWNSFSQWLLEIACQLSQGDFSRENFLKLL